jgi:putative hydrolase of the HAD superfamily
LGLVTNRNDQIQDELDDLGLTRFFDVAIYAGDVNSWKPENAIFLHALDKLQSRPENTVYVGDNYYADIVGARKAGMHQILVDVENIFPDVDCVSVSSLPDIIPIVNNQ